MPEAEAGYPILNSKPLRWRHFPSCLSSTIT